MLNEQNLKTRRYSELNDLYHQVRLQAGFKDTAMNIARDPRAWTTAGGAIGGLGIGHAVDVNRDDSKKTNFWNKNKGKIVGTLAGAGVGYGSGELLRSHGSKKLGKVTDEYIKLTEEADPSHVNRLKAIKEMTRDKANKVINDYGRNAAIVAGGVALGGASKGITEQVKKNKKDKEMGKVKLQSLINDPSVVDIQRVRLQSGETGYAVTRMHFFDKIGGSLASNASKLAGKMGEGKFGQKVAGTLTKGADWMAKNKTATGAIAAGAGAAAIGGTALAVRNRQLKKQRNRAQQVR